jgi:ethanolamine ammonia-lyase small subunit
MADEIVTRNPWESLRRFTGARIGLGRAGDSLPTDALLAFQLDHARARDAVHLPFDAAGVAGQLEAAGHEVLMIQSDAPSRTVYLRRPDLGRRLSAESRAALQARAAGSPEGYDAAFVVADGLSALAVHSHAVPLVTAAAAALVGMGWRVAPVVVASQGRVALADEVGQLLGAEQVAILIGERPGLSVADSLGVYLTYGPRPGRTDAERNCISNIHGQGLSYAAARDTLIYLMSQARRLRLTGVELKDDRGEADAAAQLPG